MDKIDTILSYTSKEDKDWCLACALVSSLDSDTREVFQDEFNDILYAMARRQLKWQSAHNKATHYRPACQVLADYLGQGKRQSSRMELRTRLPYLAEEEQRQIIAAFLSACKTDRDWVLEYLHDHWDGQYLDKVAEVFAAHRDMVSARVLCHRAPATFIEQHAQELTDAYSYYEVRMRLPKDAPVYRHRLSDNDFLALAAHLGLDISDMEAWTIFSDELKRTLEMPLPASKLVSDRGSLHRLIWALGQLGKTDILLWFMSMNDRPDELLRLLQHGEAKDLTNEQDWETCPY